MLINYSADKKMPTGEVCTATGGQFGSLQSLEPSACALTIISAKFGDSGQQSNNTQNSCGYTMMTLLKQYCESDRERLFR